MPAANPLTLSRKELEIEISSLRGQLEQSRAQLQLERQEYAEHLHEMQKAHAGVGKDFFTVVDAVLEVLPMDGNARVYASLECLRRALGVSRPTPLEPEAGT